MEEEIILTNKEIEVLNKIIHQWLWEAESPVNWNDQNIQETIDEMDFKDKLNYIIKNNLI